LSTRRKRSLTSGFIGLAPTLILERLPIHDTLNIAALRLSPWYGRFRIFQGGPEGARVRAEIIKVNAEHPEPSLIRYAADQIRAGQVLGMPTDTFYGLAADPLNLRAVDRVYDIKSRSRHKPLSLLIDSVEQAEMLAKP